MHTCSSMLSLEVLYTLSNVVQTASKETTLCVKWWLTMEWLTMEIYKIVKPKGGRGRL